MTLDGFRYPLDEIREKCDLVEIVSAYVALQKKSGRNFLGLCPFHNEKTPSFNVNPERQVWKCFGCGEGGDVFKFIQKIENMTFPQAVEHLAKKVGVEIVRSERATQEYSEKEKIVRANNAACAFFRNMLEKSAKAKEYLAKRALSAEAVERYKLGYAPDGWDGLIGHLHQQRIPIPDAVKAGLIVPRENSTGFYDRFRDRLIFPILDSQDRIIAFGGRCFGDEQPKYLNSPETPVFIKNKTLYGLNIARKTIPKEDRVIVVEGYMDVIAAQSAGFENAVATLGTALTEEHVNVISRFTKNVVLAFDSDSAGMKAALRSAPIFELAGFRVRILTMPNGEDPDSLLRGGDVARFAGLLTKTLPIPDFKIKLALSRYDLRSDEGKSGALREAVDVLAEVDSEVERERLIRFLAKYHPNFATGTTLAEDHIRRDVDRKRMKAPRRGPRNAPVIQNAQASKRKSADMGLVARSERILLGIILFCRVDASKVFAGLSPKEFTGDDTVLLADALSRQYSELGKIDQEDLRRRVADTPAEGLLLDLLLDDDDEKYTVPDDQVVQALLTHKKNERRARLRVLKAKMDGGLLKPGDPELDEYWRLAKEMSGNNASNPWRR